MTFGGGVTGMTLKKCPLRPLFGFYKYAEQAGRLGGGGGGGVGGVGDRGLVGRKLSTNWYSVSTRAQNELRK